MYSQKWVGYAINISLAESGRKELDGERAYQTCVNDLIVVPFVNDLIFVCHPFLRDVWNRIDNVNVCVAGAATFHQHGRLPRRPRRLLVAELWWPIFVSGTIYL